MKSDKRTSAGIVLSYLIIFAATLGILLLIGSPAFELVEYVPSHYDE